MFDQPAFRDAQPEAWTYHRSTARWLFSRMSPSSGESLPGREHPDAPWTTLPSARELTMPFGDVLAARLSCRDFTAGTVPLTTVATVLAHAYCVSGRTASDVIALTERPVPSGGGLYPLEISLLVRAVEGLEPGVYHYVPLAGGLEQIRAGELPRRLVTYLFMGQPWVAAASLVLVASAVTQRSLAKYGDRGYRYVLYEAGHLMQNVDLVATALGLGAINLGGFYDDELAGLLRLASEYEVPLYATALGIPASEGRMARRALPSEGLGG
jgi:SagB-type dehydrogenase family enzyme